MAELHQRTVVKVHGFFNVYKKMDGKFNLQWSSGCTMRHPNKLKSS